MFITPPTNQKTPNYDPKPYRTGAWVLGINGSFSWSYTANPENYRKENKNQINHPFYQTPDHMKVED